MANKAKVVFGQVSNWNAADWRSVGNVAQGLLQGDLESVCLNTALFQLPHPSCVANSCSPHLYATMV
jgi:hypothetical protein